MRWMENRYGTETESSRRIALRWRFGSTLPSGDHGSSDGVANDIRGRSPHIEDVVNGKHKRYAAFGKFEVVQRHRDNGNGSAGYTGDAFGRHDEQAE